MLTTLFQIIVLIYSVVIHELAHGLMARSLGDQTAERMGRLTLNPLAHFDMFGSFILPIVSKLTTGMMFGYAKPVPYEPGKLRDQVWGPSKVALVGPLTNIILAVGAGLIMRLAGPVMSRTAVELLGYVVWINLIIALFNLVPIPPLDGHWILMAVLPTRFHSFKIALFRYQLPLMVLFIFFIFPLFYPVLVAVFQVLTGIHLF